jgi:hypothetical protein
VRARHVIKRSLGRTSVWPVLRCSHEERSDQRRARPNRAVRRECSGHYGGVRILLFLHGTAIMHAAAVGVPRRERVRQSARRVPSVADFGSYVPTEAAVEKAVGWHWRGARICYLSSHRTPADVDTDRMVLRAHGFPDGPVFSRAAGETYADVARRARADVVVEDDCESIGGATQMTASGLPPEAIHCVVVPEFGGLAHLPDDPAELLAV